MRTRQVAPLARPQASARGRVGADPTLRVWGVWIIAAKILATTLAIDTLGADPFALPKSAVSRALLYVLIAVAAAHVLRTRAALRPTALHLAVAAVLGSAALSTLVAVDPAAALYGAFHRHLGLTNIADNAALALLIGLLVRTWRDVRVVTTAAILGLITSLAYGVVQLLRLDPIPWANPVIASFLGNSTTYAGYLTIMAATILAAALILKVPTIARTSLILVDVLAVFVLASTGARTAVLALLPAMMCAGVLAYRIRSGSAGLRRRWVLLTLAVALGTAAVLAVSTPVVTRIERLVSGSDGSVVERRVIYETAGRAFLERPVLGVGPDGFGVVYYVTRSPETARIVELTAGQTSTHSWVLHTALGTGVLGLAALAAVVLLAMRRAWWLSLRPNGVHSALGLTAIMAYLFQGTFTVNSVVTDMHFWVGVGLVTVPELRELERPQPRSARTVATLVVVLAIGVALATTVADAVIANRAIRVSNLARERGDFELAARAAGEAVRRDPRRPDNWNVLGLAYSRRDPQRARSAFNEASTHAPYDPVYRLNAASEEALLVSSGRGDFRAAALAGSEQAVRQDPNGVVTLRRASEVFAAVNELDRALATARRARDLLPSDPYVHDWLAELLERSGHPSEALQELEVAISLQPSYAVPSRLDLPKELRLRLARLYAALDRLSDARAVLSPPRVGSVDTACNAPDGMGLALNGARKPLCVRVLFSTDQPLRDDAGSGSVRNVANYLADGSALPAGSIVEYDGTVVATVHLPAGATPPLRVTVRDVTNLIGQVVPTAEWPVP